MSKDLRVALRYLGIKIGSKDSSLIVICFCPSCVNPCAGSREVNSPSIYICMQFEHRAA